LWISLVCFGAAGIIVAPVVFGLDQPNQLIPAAVSLLFGLAFLRATDVTFDKIGRICDIRRFDVLRVMRLHLAFEDIRDVRVEICPTPSDSRDSWRLSLGTGQPLCP
jgi:hypothetical protein